MSVCGSFATIHHTPNLTNSPTKTAFGERERINNREEKKNKRDEPNIEPFSFSLIVLLSEQHANAIYFCFSNHSLSFCSLNSNADVYLHKTHMATAMMFQQIETNIKHRFLACIETHSTDLFEQYGFICSHLVWYNKHEL